MASWRIRERLEGDLEYDAALRVEPGRRADDFSAAARAAPGPVILIDSVREHAEHTDRDRAASEGKETRRARPSTRRCGMSATATTRGRRIALAGLGVNLALALGKLYTGVVGNSYALVADAVESLVDVAGSAVIWAGLKYGNRPADAEHPYGHGRAESLAALSVAVLVFAAGVGIMIEAIREIITPHHGPAWYTLVVLVGVVVVKEGLFRLARRAARQSGSSAVGADAWHHRSDAITSAIAFIGISIALVGGAGYERADDWAAIAASIVIMINGVLIGRAPLGELLDTQPTELVEAAAAIAASVAGVVDVEKTRARKSGTAYWLDMHVRVDPRMSVREAHALSHRVKDAVRSELPRVRDVLIHIEPAVERE